MPWWISGIDRERWEGPYASREDAIEAGPGYFDEEAFYVCEAESEDHNILMVDAEDVLDRLGNVYEHISDPDGDGLFTDVSDADVANLGILLTAAVHEWVVEYDIKTGINTLKDSTIRNEERIAP